MPDPPPSDRPSQMIVVGIERQADGLLVVHHATSESTSGSRTASSPEELWATLQAVLTDPSIPRVQMEQAGTTTLEEAIAQVCGSLVDEFVQKEAPHLKPLFEHVSKRVQRFRERQQQKKNNGIFARTAVLPTNKYYPRGS